MPPHGLLSPLHIGVVVLVLCSLAPLSGVCIAVKCMLVVVCPCGLALLGWCCGVSDVCCGARHQMGRCGTFEATTPRGQPVIVLRLCIFSSAYG